jgi:hypothetical protein
MELTAKHYLDIWRLRVSMAEQGVAHPMPDVLAAAKRLVSKLAAMDQTDKVRLETAGSKARFLNAATGELLAEISNEENPQPPTPPYSSNLRG